MPLRSAALVLLPLLTACPAAAKAPAQPDLGTRWVRDSVEYDAVVAGTYASALDEILHDATRLPPDTDWVVVSDVDETLVDNSGYQVEVAGQFTAETWAAWEASGKAEAIPGAVDFVARIHAAGGRMAFVTNRRNHQATLELLKARGLWGEDDRLCVRTEDSDKGPRRASVREGTALCGWEGQPMTVLAYLGDQRSDFPTEGEESRAMTPWGDRWFMLPNPMYGRWAR